METRNCRTFKTTNGSEVTQCDLYDENGNWWGIEETSKMTREMVERIWNGIKIKGDMGKLTPFQQTVNTYIDNRMNELLKLTPPEAPTPNEETV